MDKNELSPFKSMPTKALSLNLARTTIKIEHDKNWRIDKLSPDHDLIICLAGKAQYKIDDQIIELTPGRALLIPAWKRFKGQHGGGEENYLGIAQHFNLELFGRGDAISKMKLNTVVDLPDWDFLKTVVWQYRKTSPISETTLSQHHSFMVLLLAFLETAFIDWQAERSHVPNEDQLSLQIMLVASGLSSDPVSEKILDEVMNTVPYHPDYFRRAFSDRIGMTPVKYREHKRMEFAIHRLGMGLSVKAVAAELGYTDQYYFSRLFKKYIGASPSRYRDKANKILSKSFN